MKLRRPTTLAAALIAAASFSGGTALAATSGPAATVRPNTFIAYDDGYGATASAAQKDAVFNLHGDYYGCTTPYLVFDDQQSDGSWWAEVEAACQGYN